MNVYRWVHLSKDGYKKDGPIIIHAENSKRAYELIPRGFTYCEDDQFCLEWLEETKDKREWVKDYGVWD